MEVDKLDSKLFQKFETLKLFCNKKISYENIISCIIFTMKLLKKSSMSGIQKKETTISLILALINEFSDDSAFKTIFTENFIGATIESVYGEFTKKFKNHKCCF